MNLSHRLKEVFGFEQFRPGQEEAIQRLMNDGSLLCILPTGHGKSLLYQLPATLLPGMTLVISPLLALMRDQIQQLRQRFGIAAAALNSDQSDEENHEVRRAVMANQVKILFVAPEQLDHVDRAAFLAQLPVNLLVIDEAHCISTWGHDFRPSYRQIVTFAQQLCQKGSDLKLLALTATADRRTEADIAQQLSINGRPHQVIRHSMHRPNIQLSVFKAPSLSSKLEACQQLLGQLEGTGLIYCATRENTEIVADYLSQQGVQGCVAYHAGLAPDKKRELQQAFISDQYRVMAATNALGLGIDKSNLRFIIHFDIPGSITAYYQEVGRAGRDGQPARGILIYDPADRKIQQHFIDSALPKIDDFQAIFQAIANAEEPPGLMAIKRITGLHPTRVTVVVAELLEQGFLRKYSSAGKQVYECLPREGEPLLTRYENQSLAKSRELQNMLNYSEQGENCRMGILRAALGDQNPEPCGNCSICHTETLSLDSEHSRVAAIDSWIAQRPVEIAAKATHKMSEGLAVFDGKQRSPAFVRFMRGRAQPGGTLDSDLKGYLEPLLCKLHQRYGFGGVLVLPSRTWTSREQLAQWIGVFLQVPVHLGVLEWRELPPARQGELLNNDQRRHNVGRRMGAQGTALLGTGPLLLLDDYTGSGATLAEAMRVMRKELGLKQAIVPFTVASVRWRLGSPGMI